MKKGDLINLLKDIPDDAEIVVNGYACEILGDYNYNPDITINEHDARADFSMTISNYSRTDEIIRVWVLE